MFIQFNNKYELNYHRGKVTVTKSKLLPHYDNGASDATGPRIQHQIFTFVKTEYIKRIPPQRLLLANSIRKQLGNI